MSRISSLDKSLSDWVSRGFLTKEQANRISEYESSKPEASWVLTSVLILGAVIIGVGFISLIAANWEHIPDGVKLGADFALLCACGVATYHAWKTHKAVQFEAYLVFFLIACLATIGLVSQIYNTGGELYQALLFWSFITLGAASTSKYKFVPLAWVAAHLSGIVFTALDSNLFRPVFERNYHGIVMAIPLYCAALRAISKSLMGDSAMSRAFRDWTLFSGLAGLVVAEVAPWDRDSVHAGTLAYIPGYVLGAIVFIELIRSPHYRRIQKTLLLSALALFVFSFHLPRLHVESSFMYAISTIAVLGAMAMFLASEKERFLFQQFLFLVGIRFLVLYFQALGGLALTGVGLIVSGGLVIATAVVWNKYRVAIAQFAESLSQ